MGHAPFAYWLVSELKPSKIVELGTHWGDSFFVFCTAVRDKDISAECFAIDKWEGDDHAGHYDLEVFESVKSIRNREFRDFANLIRSDFNEAVSKFEDQSIDLLHIDGFHSYEAVKNDYETWLPKLTDDAVVMFHDTHEKREGFGVYKFWDELRQFYPNHADFTHSHGLGVVSLGKFPLRETLTNHFGDSWKSYFEYSGHFSTENSLIMREKSETINSLRESLNELESKNLQLRKQLSTSEKEMAKLRDEVQKSQEVRAELEAQIDFSLTQAESTNAALKSLNTQLARLEDNNREIVQSRTWRLTSPIRKLFGFLR